MADLLVVDDGVCWAPGWRDVLWAKLLGWRHYSLLFGVKHLLAVWTDR
ncbi:hypothetical protein [Chloroflexus aggregans]|nr:hypothetical protein [Chloroflexus aggregans]